MNNEEHSDQRILQTLGERLQQERLSRNWSQQELAERAGVGKRTLAKAEGGGVTTLATLIAILRGLGALDRLELLFPEPGPSPVQLAKWKGQQRKKASKPREKKTAEKESGNESTLNGWTWGE